MRSVWPARWGLKWMALALAALVVAGCSGGQGSPAQGEETPGSAVQPQPDAADSGPVPLTMWAHRGQEAEVKAIEEIVAAFNAAHQGKIQVTLHIIPADGFAYEDKVKAAAASGGAPDILDLDGPNMAAYAYSGILRPLDQFMTAADRERYVDSILQQGTWNNQVYALGAFESSLVIYYNKQMLAEANIQPPASVSEAWTADKFFSVAQQLTIPGQRWGMEWMMHWGPGEWYTYMATPFIWSNGGQIIAADGSTALGHLDSPETLEVLNWFQRFFREGVSTASPGAQDFIDGKAAMMINGPWYISTLNQASGLEWGTMPLPYFDQPVSPSGSWAWGVTRQSQHPAEAMEVVRWLTGTDTGVLPMVKANSMPPATRDAYAKLPEYSEMPKRVFGEQVQTTARARPVTPAYPTLTNQFAKALQTVALGGDAAAAARAAAEAVDQDIQAHNGYAPLIGP